MKQHRNNATPKSQKERIKNAMLAGQRLTCLDALQKFDCLNLRNRISELVAERQHKINKAWKTLRNGKRVMVYSIDI